MAAPVYSLRIVAESSLVPAAGKVGPLVPDGLVYIVRDIDVVRRSTGSTDELVVYSQVEGLIWNVTVALLDASSNAHWRGRQVFNEGEQVAVQAIVGTWDIAVSGYQLTLP